MGKERVYISGPIAHYEIGERKQAFHAASLRIEMSGRESVNPFDNGVPEDAGWQEHMKADIRMLLSCDGIYMLPEWYRSKGCKLELDVASSCGLKVYY